MSIFVVADLHLSFFEGIDKPMDIFGPEWKDHGKLPRHDYHEAQRIVVVVIDLQQV